MAFSDHCSICGAIDEEGTSCARDAPAPFTIQLRYGVRAKPSAFAFRGRAERVI
jgi:hypothetical protein